MSNLKTAHKDAALKGAVLGLLTLLASNYDVPMETVALVLPVATLALSFVSTRIGDKNTALLLKLAKQAVAAAPAKAPAKKTAAKKK
jgi:hypothetical protein